MNKLGNNIKTLRLSRGLTQQQLADEMGASNYTTVSKWESGSNSPRGGDLVLLSKLFNVSVDELLGLTDNLSISHEYNYYPTAISAGLPYEVDGITQKDIQKLSIPDAIMGKHAGDQSIMLMRVNGDSMNKTMPDQSLIAVKPVTLDQLSNDDIVVYSYNHEYSVKYYYKDGDEIIFRPHSTDRVHRDTVFNLDDANELHIHGKVVMYIVDRD